MADTAVKHTPGPWHMSSTHLGKAWDIGAANGDNICLVHSDAERGSWEFVGNARLICAAPDLLEALQTIKAEYGYTFPTDTNQMINAAIAKAAGKS